MSWLMPIASTSYMERHILSTGLIHIHLIWHSKSSLQRLWGVHKEGLNPPPSVCLWHQGFTAILPLFLGVPFRGNCKQSWVDISINRLIFHEYIVTSHSMYRWGVRLWAMLWCICDVSACDFLESTATSFKNASHSAFYYFFYFLCGGGFTTKFRKREQIISDFYFLLLKLAL